MSTLVTPAQPGPEQQDAPLTEQERKLLARLLSDPTYFPVEFRTWIRTYLEGSDIRLPSSAIVGGNAPKVQLPAGTILPFAGGTIPSNCLLCNGQAVLRADYELLFDAIGTTWGVGNGTSTFNVPDLRDRALYGAGSVVGLAATDGRAAGSRGGPIHKHNFNQTSGGGGCPLAQRLGFDRHSRWSLTLPLWGWWNSDQQRGADGCARLGWHVSLPRCGLDWGDGHAGRSLPQHLRGNLDGWLALT